MSSRAFRMYSELADYSAIQRLVGQTEDASFDCKVWPPREEDQQKTIAKGICGFANGDGGVLVIGVAAKRGSDQVDVVTGLEPVSDTKRVKSAILDLAGKLVEPGVEAIDIREINHTADNSGFVIVYVPCTDGPPCRSRKDWQFYVRIGSGTFPMEYFQIADMFGRRAHPKLELHLEFDEIGIRVFEPGRLVRRFILGLRNDGRGMAKFPGIRYSSSSGFVAPVAGLDAETLGLPYRPSAKGWIAFRGGVDDVIYPEETRQIARIFQYGKNVGLEGIPFHPVQDVRLTTRWVFPAANLICEISAEGVPTITASRVIDEDSHIASSSQG